MQKFALARALYKEADLVVLDVISKYDFTSYDSLISMIKNKLRTVIPVIIVGVD